MVFSVVLVTNRLRVRFDRRNGICVDPVVSIRTEVRVLFVAGISQKCDALKIVPEVGCLCLCNLRRVDEG